MLQQIRSAFASRRTSLGEVLSDPQARVVAASSALARLPKGMVPLGTVLVLRDAGGSFALAGLTAGLVAVGDAATTPVQGRLVDRFGPRPVLLPIALLHVVAVVALLASVRSAPEPVVVTCGVAVGVGVPPVSGSVKAVWPRIVAPRAVPAAYTVESLLQQLVFLTGPLLVAAIVAVSGPVVALASAAAAVLVGTAWFVAATSGIALRDDRSRRRGNALRDRTVAVLTASALAQGAAFGGLPVGVVALAGAAHCDALAGVVQAMLTVGGVIGTAMPVAGTGRRALVRLTTAFGVALTPVVLLALRPHLATLLAVGLVLLVAGLLLIPVAATSYVIVQQRVDAARRTESFAWLSTGLAAGNAVGAAVVGLLVDRPGVPVALAVLPVAVLAGAGLALLLGDHA